MNDTPDEGYTWSLRLRWNAGQEATVYARNNSFKVGQPASFRASDPLPSAVEYLLGALGADLANGFQHWAEQAGIVIDALELALSGTLANPLAYLGVIGASGVPYLAAVAGTLYVSADADEAALRSVWQTTQERSPVANTLARGATIEIELSLVY